jgi:hypothetical protein
MNSQHSAKSTPTWKNNLIRIIGLTLLILCCSPNTNIGKGQELIQAPAAIHISSTVSDGKYSIDEIVEIARLNDVKVVIITDRELMRWEYGLWPLRNIIKKTVESNSVFKYGIKRYLNAIRKAQEKNPDMAIIPAVESAPFYYWEGNPFGNNLKMYNWHKHILAIGLDGVDDYRHLPVIGNRRALSLPFRLKDVYRLWPVLILIVGVLYLRKRKFRYRDLKGHSLGPYSRPWQIFGGVFIVIGFLFFLNNYPFCEFKFNQYQGDLGIMPYQNFIDYVNQRGGVTFWAHPEAEYIQKRGRVSIETRAHTGDLLEAKDYTGFAVFYEGYKKVGHPGGIWDDVLLQYCQGKRKSPIWAIAGLSYDQTGELSNRMKALRTVFLVPELNKAAVLEALKKGRMYAVKGGKSSQFILDRFIVTDSSTSAYAIMGEEIKLKGKPVIEISGQFLNNLKRNIEIKLIRNGQIIKTFEVSSPFDISYQDDYEARQGKIYYRLEIESAGLLLVTNPIFVLKRLLKKSIFPTDSHR